MFLMQFRNLPIFVYWTLVLDTGSPLWNRISWSLRRLSVCWTNRWDKWHQIVSFILQTILHFRHFWRGRGTSVLFMWPHWVLFGGRYRDVVTSGKFLGTFVSGQLPPAHVLPRNIIDYWWRNQTHKTQISSCSGQITFLSRAAAEYLNIARPDFCQQMSEYNRSILF